MEAVLKWGCGAVALLVALHYSSKLLQAVLIRLLGRGVYLALFGFIGIAFHELSHALMCVIFGHRITRMSLFTLNPDNLSWGNVGHSWSPGNPYQALGNPFIGIAPLICGAAAIPLLGVWLLDIEPGGFENLFSIVTWQGFGKGTASLGEFGLFLYLTICIWSALWLSPEDLGVRSASALSFR